MDFEKSGSIEKIKGKTIKKRMNRSAFAAVLSVFLIMTMLLCGCAQQPAGVDYTKSENWAYLPAGERLRRHTQILCSGRCFQLTGRA
jgi:hypothetical protein